MNPADICPTTLGTPIQASSGRSDGRAGPKRLSCVRGTTWTDCPRWDPVAAWLCTRSLNSVEREWNGLAWRGSPVRSEELKSPTSPIHDLSLSFRCDMHGIMGPYKVSRVRSVLLTRFGRAERLVRLRSQGRLLITCWQSLALPRACNWSPAGCAISRSLIARYPR